MFTVRVLNPNTTTSRDYPGMTKNEALSFIRRFGGAPQGTQVKVGRIARFARLYVVQYAPAR